MTLLLFADSVISTKLNPYIHAMKLPCCFIILLLLQGSIPTFAQSGNDSVIVLPVRITAPANAKKLGAIRAGNNATKTHCDYEAIIQEAKNKARAMGGNIVKITRLIQPAFISKCYSIAADVYYASELPVYTVPKTNENNTSMSGKQEYALLYIYRLSDTIAFAGSYHVHLDNDSVICSVKSKSRDSVKIYKEGPVKLWARTESKGELILSVKFGAVYYIRCGLKKGEIRMIPILEVVDKETGAREYKHLLNGKKDMDVIYLDQIH